MNQEDMQKSLKLLFEKFWIIKSEDMDSYSFIRKNERELQQEIKKRFGMTLVVRPQFIQLLKRPHTLDSWMGNQDFHTPLDYVLLCCAMAFLEDLDGELPFMLDELVSQLDILVPKEVTVDWVNYNHRKSLVRVLKQLIKLSIITVLEGDMVDFEHSEYNQNILYQPTVQSRYFLAGAPKAYTDYQSFDDYWQDLNHNRQLEANQLMMQRLFMEPVIIRTVENQETFNRLRNYHHHMIHFIEDKTYFSYELYKDYAALTLNQQDGYLEVFPSRKVVDDILIQLATLVRKEDLLPSSLGLVTINSLTWDKLIKMLINEYYDYWSKEFKEMTEPQLSDSLLIRGTDWELFEKIDDDIIIYPMFSRLIAEMRDESE